MKLLAFGLLCTVTACGTVRHTAVVKPPVARVPPPQKLVMEPIRLQAVPAPDGGEVQVKVVDAAGLFERGGQLLSAKKYAAAIKVYDQLLTTFPHSRFISPALYNTGLCHEWLGQFQQAAGRYQEMIRQFGQTKEAVDAGFRLGGCYAELQNWASSAQVFQVLLARRDLGASDRIEACTRKGLAHFRMGDTRACKSTLEEGIKYYKSVEAMERLDNDFFLAMAHYYLAAVPHVEFRKLTVDASKSAELGHTLDEKARLLLVSQARYIRTIKVKNPYWAAASGFQIGSLYREFYSTLLTALPDFTRQARRNARLAKISQEAAHKQLVRVYMEEVHKAVKPLLHKAIRVFEKNVEMGERVGVQSNWVSKSRQQIQDLKHLLSLSPGEAVDRVHTDTTLPEDVQPPTHPSTRPAKTPVQNPPREDPDEPGRVVL